MSPLLTLYWPQFTLLTSPQTVGRNILYPVGSMAREPGINDCSPVVQSASTAVEILAGVEVLEEM